MSKETFNLESKVLWTIDRRDGSVWRQQSKNVQTNDGINWMAQVLGNAWGDVSATGNAPRQIAITENSAAPSSGDTNLLGELAADGLSRQTATFSHTADASSFTQSVSMQYTGASTVTVAKAALASALTDTDLSSDTHFAITAVSPVAVLNSDDTLSLDWGVFW